MPVFLKQKTTGDLYAYSPIMAERDDMELIDTPDIAPASPPPAPPPPPVEKPKVSKKVAAAIPVTPAPEEQSHGLDLDALFKPE